MTSARRIWWLSAVVAGLGAGALTIALGIAVSRVCVGEVSMAAFIDACRRWPSPDVSFASIVVLGVSMLAAASVVLWARAAFSEAHALRRLRRALHIVGRTRSASIVRDDAPHAFCLGYLRPRIYVTTGAIAALAPAELEAVLAHERHHAMRRDPLRLLLARAAAAGLFFLPVVGRLADRYAAVAEVAADEAAVQAAGSRAPLAAALLAFDAAPPERVDHLLGRRSTWAPPLPLLAGAVATIAMLLSVVLVVAATAAPMSVELPVLPSQACLLALIVAPLLAFGRRPSRLR